MNSLDLAQSLAEGQSFSATQLVEEFERTYPGVAGLHDALNAQGDVNHALIKALLEMLEGDNRGAITSLKEAQKAHLPLSRLTADRSTVLVRQMASVADQLIGRQ